MRVEGAGTTSAWYVSVPKLLSYLAWTGLPFFPASLTIICRPAPPGSAVRLLNLASLPVLLLANTLHLTLRDHSGPFPIIMLVLAILLATLIVVYVVFLAFKHYRKHRKGEIVLPADDA